MDEPRTSSGDSQESATALFGHLVKVAVSETAVTWAVRRALDAGYRRATGRPIPSAREPDVAFGRIVLWAVIAAAAVAAADVVVDRVVLRPKQPNHRALLGGDRPMLDR
jgi:hypothetical protein